MNAEHFKLTATVTVSESPEQHIDVYSVEPSNLVFNLELTSITTEQRARALARHSAASSGFPKFRSVSRNGRIFIWEFERVENDT